MTLAPQHPDLALDPDRARVASVADRYLALMRSTQRARTRLLAAAGDNLEWTAHIILKLVESAGPLRAAALADQLQSDPSTVSRQVASLVRDGLLERRTDPADGRASLLAVTPRAQTVLEQQAQIRLDRFAQLLADWSAEDLDRFAGLLGRFAHDLDNTDPTWLADRFSRRSTGSTA